MPHRTLLPISMPLREVTEAGGLHEKRSSVPESLDAPKGRCFSARLHQALVSSLARPPTATTPTEAHSIRDYPCNLHPDTIGQPCPPFPSCLIAQPLTVLHHRPAPLPFLSLLPSSLLSFSRQTFHSQPFASHIRESPTSQTALTGSR